MKNPRYTVLIVEDNPDHVLLERSVVEDMDIISSIDAVSSADDALKALKQKKYDVMLIDFDLPGMDGLSLIKRLKRKKMNMVIIMLTGLGNAKVAVEAMKAGAYDYITKESGYLKFIPATIETALEKYELLCKLEKAETELKNSETKLRALIEYSPDAVFMKDKKGKYILLNRAAVELIRGLEHRILPGELTEGLSKSEENMISKKCSSAAQIKIHLEGEDKYMDILKYPVLDDRGKVVHICTICRDVSERKKVERLKDNLIRDLSHELKTPVAVTAMAVDMSQRAIEEEDFDRIKKAQCIAEKNLQRLLQNIDNILNLFKIGSRKKIEEEEVFSLKDVVGEIVEELDYNIEAKKIKIDISIDREAEMFLGSKRTFRTLFYNMIDNSVKFTQNGTITISGRVKGKWLEMTIVDSGVGISSENIGKVFDRFYQQHTAIQGTGLGLTICREIIRLYKGRIKINSKGKDKGTEVIVRLPADRLQKNGALKKQGKGG